MIGPLAKTGEISQTADLWLAVFPIGFLFGYFLQRSGFTDSRKVAAVFYLKDVDVPVVMFTAIVVGMLGLFGLSLFGLLDISRVYLLPTYLGPMAAGGLLFGVGMAIGGFCPGTSVASVATGKLDALVFVIGVFVGTLIFGDFYPAWQGFYLSGYKNVYSLNELLHLGLAPTMFLVILLAVGASMGLRGLQQYFWNNVERKPSPRRRALVAVALASAAVVAFLIPTQAFFAIENTAGSMGGWDRPWADPLEKVMVDPLAAGEVVYRHSDRTQCFDLRSPAEFEQGHLRGARNITASELAQKTFLPGTVVLAYAQKDDPNLRSTVKALRQQGVRAFGVEGGFQALKPYYIEPITGTLEKSLGRQKVAALRTYRALISPDQTANAPEPDPPAGQRAP
jgi:rhodanese-related sulfurtransferase/uncharacterized membrane protein YedE/YeeE